MATDDVPGDAAVIERIISMIDLTDLDDAHRADGIPDLLARSARHTTAAVCLWPEFVRPAADELRGTGVRVATVVNFPEGTKPVDDVMSETVDALGAGADEIDVVFPWRSFLDGDTDHARNVLERASDLVHESPGALLKAILETGELGSSSSIAEASRLAIGCGADFLKTSTGKTGNGASLEAAGIMLDVIADDGGSVGIKPSGGVRTVADALGYLDLAERRMGAQWATPSTFRFGASGLLADALDRTPRP